MTTFENKCKILSDIWGRWNATEEVKTLFQTFDLGFPYAYGLAKGHILNVDESAEKMIEETFDSLLQTLGIEDTGFSDSSQVHGWIQ